MIRHPGHDPGSIRAAVRDPSFFGPAMGEIERGVRPAELESLRRSLRRTRIGTFVALILVGAALICQQFQLVSLHQDLAATQAALRATAKVAVDARASRQLSGLLGLALETWEAAEAEPLAEGIHQ